MTDADGEVDFSRYHDPLTSALIKHPVKYEGKLYEESVIRWWNERTQVDNPQYAELSTDERRNFDVFVESHTRHQNHNSNGSTDAARDVGTQFDVLDASNGLERIMPTALRDMNLRNIQGAEYTGPEIAFIGQESAGKSSVVGRFISRDLFPVGRQRCTLLPCVFKLKTGDATIPKIRVVKLEGPNLENEVPFPVQVTKYCCTKAEHEASRDAPVEVKPSVYEDYVPIASLPTAINDRMLAVTNPLLDLNNGQPIVDRRNNVKREFKRVSMEHLVIVEMSAWNFPNMTLIDLPGISTTAEDSANTLELSRRVLSKKADNCFIVVVKPLETATEDCKGCKLVSEMELLSSASCVVTKADRIRFSTQTVDDWMRVAELNKFSFGYSLVGAGRPSVFSSPQQMFQDMQSREKTSCHVDEEVAATMADAGIPSPDSIIGIRNARNNITRAFEAYLCQVWVPKTIHLIFRHLNDLHIKADALGFPFVTFQDEKQARDTMSKAMTSLGSTLTFRETFTKEEVSNKALDRLREMLLEIPFEAKLSDVIATTFTDALYVFEQQQQHDLDNAMATTNIYTSNDLFKLSADVSALEASVLATYTALVDNLSSTEGAVSAVVAAFVKDKLVNDASSFKFGRFESLVETYIAALIKHLQTTIDPVLVSAAKAFNADLETRVHTLFSVTKTTGGARHIFLADNAIHSLASSLEQQLLRSLHASARGNVGNFLLECIPQSDPNNVFVEKESVTQERATHIDHMTSYHQSLIQLREASDRTTVVPNPSAKTPESELEKAVVANKIKEVLTKICERDRARADAISAHSQPPPAEPIKLTLRQKVGHFEETMSVLSLTRGASELIIRHQDIEKVSPSVLDLLFRRAVATTSLTITPEIDFKHIFSALKSNVTLKTLSLEGATPSDEFRTALVALFKANTTVQVLLQEKHFSEDERAAIDAAILPHLLPFQATSNDDVVRARLRYI